MSTHYIEATHTSKFTRERLLQVHGVLVTVNVPTDYVGETLTVQTARSLCVEIAGEFCHVDLYKDNTMNFVSEYGSSKCAKKFAELAGIVIVSEHSEQFDYYSFPVDTKVAVPYMLVDGWRVYVVDGWVYPYYSEDNYWAHSEMVELTEGFDWDRYFKHLTQIRWG